MVKLSKHFSLDELCKTSRSFNNVPSRDNVINLCYGVNNILEPLRAYLRKPLTVTSGFRCPEVNKAVGGVANSQHLRGLAVDVHIEPSDMGLAFMYLRTNKFCDQVLGGKSFIHISWTIDGSPRQQYIKNYYKY